MANEDLSILASNNVPNLFKEMFLDSVVAQQMRMSYTKVSCVFGYRLGPYFQHKIIGDILRTKDFYSAIHFDETTTS